MSELSLEAGLLDIPKGIPIIVIDSMTECTEAKPYAEFTIFTKATIVVRKEDEEKGQLTTQPHTQGSQRSRRLYPVELESIETAEYLRHFVLFETYTLAILAMHHANCIEEYYDRWRLIEDGRMSLYRRVILVDKIRQQFYPEVKQKITGIHDLSDVRNQLAHTLYPLTISYKKKDYFRNDEFVKQLLSMDLTKELYTLTSLYKVIQDLKLRSWVLDKRQ